MRFFKNLLFGFKAYIKAIYMDNAMIAKNPIPPSMWSYNNSIEGYSYDITKAKALLKKAGYEKGFETELIGTEDMEGTEVFKIKQSSADGDIFYQYIDTENFVLLKTSAILKMGESETTSDSYFSNFNEHEGVVTPYNIEVKMNVAEWFKNPNTWDLNTLFASLMPNFNAQKMISANGSQGVFTLGTVTQ